MTIAPEISKTPESHKPQSPTLKAPPLWQALRAIIAKELRQNLIFLALVLVLEVLIAFTCQYFSNGSLLDSGNRYDNILLYSATAQGVTFSSIIAAFLIGLFQPLAERQFDVWSFLVHRPLPRRVLFLGRMIAGLILYGVATGLPILLLCIIATTPSGGEFFLWQYTLPSIADFCLGIPFYFAGLIIAERQSRLYGSRLLPLALAGTVSIASFAMHSFVLVVLLSLGTAILLGLACEGSSITHGFTLPAPRRSRLGISLLLWLSLSILVLVGTSAARDRLEVKNSNYLSEANHEDQMKKATVISEHVLLRNGTLAVRTTTSTSYDAWRRGNPPDTVSFSDLDGHPLPLPFHYSAYSADFEDSSILSFRKSFWHWYPHPTYRQIDQLAERDLIHLDKSDLRSPQEDWYFVPSRKIYYIYQRPATQGRPTYLGTFGRNGFCPTGPDALPLDGTMYSWHFYSDHQLYRIQYKEKKLVPIFQTPPDETILKWTYLTGSNPDATDKDLEKMSLQVLTSNRYLHLTPDGVIQVTLPLTHDPRSNEIHVFRRTGSFDGKMKLSFDWVIRYLTPNPNGPYPMDNAADTWEFYNDSGTLLATKSFPKFRSIDPPTDTSPLSLDRLSPYILRNIRRNEMREGALLALANPAFILLYDSVDYDVALRSDQPLGQLRQYNGPVHLWTLPSQPWIMLPCIGVMAISGFFGFLLTALYRSPLRMVWTLLAFLSGPIALLTFISVHTLPRRARCPNCHQLRPLNENLCPRCKSPWPLPTPNATEIFA